MLEEYAEMKRIVKNGTIYFFNTGGHPAIVTNAEEFSEIALKFLNS